MIKVMKLSDIITVAIIIGAMFFQACNGTINAGCGTCSRSGIQKFDNKCFGDWLGATDHIEIETINLTSDHSCCFEVQITGSGIGLFQDYGNRWDTFTFSGEMTSEDEVTIDVDGIVHTSDGERTVTASGVTLSRVDNSSPIIVDPGEGWAEVSLEECQRECADPPARNLITGCFRSHSGENWMFIQDDMTECDRVTGRLQGVFTDDNMDRAPWYIGQNEITEDNRATLTLHNPDVESTALPTRTIEIHRFAEGAPLDIGGGPEPESERHIVVGTLPYSPERVTEEQCRN